MDVVVNMVGAVAVVAVALGAVAELHLGVAEVGLAAHGTLVVIPLLLLLLMDNAAQTAYLSSIPILSDVLDWFSNQTKFYVFSQGLLQISDLLGYVTEILVFLIWTIISVEKRRWSRG